MMEIFFTRFQELKKQRRKIIMEKKVLSVITNKTKTEKKYHVKKV